MRFFKAFQQGRWTKYIDNCLKFPVPYQEIYKSDGYDRIINSQFNRIEFNKSLFPQFINLMGRDLKVLHQKGFNQCIQALSCYVESSNANQTYDQTVLENFVKQINLNATYVQKCIFLFTLTQAKVFDDQIIQKKQILEKLTNDLLRQETQNNEENLWKIVIEMLQFMSNKENRQNEEIMKINGKVIMKKFIDEIQHIEINQSQFTNIETIIQIQRHLQITKYFLSPIVFDVNQLAFIPILMKFCQKYISENASSLNSFGFHQYLNLISRTQDTSCLDIILDELTRNRDLNEMPITEVLSIVFDIKSMDKLTDQLSRLVLKYLDENIDVINQNEYSRIFQFIQWVEDKYVYVFLTKVQNKIIPQNLSLEDNAYILYTLYKFGRIDENILNKYLLGIGTRINQVDKELAIGILCPLNTQYQAHPEFISKVLSFQLDNKDWHLQIEILKYFQTHDPQHERIYQIQKNIAQMLKEYYDIGILHNFIRALLHLKQNDQRTIVIIDEMRKYVYDDLKEACKNGLLNKESQKIFREKYMFDL